MVRGQKERFCYARPTILMVSLDTKIKVMMFFKRILRKDVNWICRKLKISRATFYRHKKKLNAKMVITKR